MNNKNFLTASSLALFSIAFYPTAASAASVTANASANVITPLVISETSGMNFGDVSVGTIGGTVVLDAGGGRSVTGDAEAVLGGTEAAGSYSLTGEGAKAYTITFPVNATILSGGNSMIVDNFTHNAGATPALTGGSGAFNVGATLNIGPGQAPGLYSGTYTLTVNYQ